MPRISAIKPKELAAILEKIGFKFTRQKGSHARYVHPDGRKTTVLIHSAKEICPGLLNKIIKKDLLMNRDEFNKLLD